MVEKCRIKSNFLTTRPIYFLSRVLGLAPYVYRQNKMKADKFGILLQIGWLFLILIAGNVPIYKVEMKKLESKGLDDISRYVGIFRTGIGMIITIVVTIKSLLERKEVCEFFHNLAAFDTELKRLKIHVNYNEISKNILVTTFITYFLISIILSIDFLLFTSGHVDILHYLYWCICIVIFLTNIMPILQFVSFGYLIYKR